MKKRSKRFRSITTFTLAVAAVCAGCSTGTDASADALATASAEAVQGTYTLDRETGAITFPADRFMLSNEEEAELSAVSSILLESCAGESGIEFGAWESRHVPEYDASTLYGVWTPALAARFGFVTPMSDADLRANGVTVHQPGTEKPPEAQDHDRGVLDSSPEAEDVLAECQSTPEYQAIDSFQFYRTQAWSVPLGDAFEAAQQSDEFEAAVTDLHECFRADGLRPEGFAVKGTDISEISAEQIDLALRVVECKDDVDFVRRAVVEVARHQLPIVERYENELTAHRAAIDEALARAETIRAGEVTAD